MASAELRVTELCLRLLLLAVIVAGADLAAGAPPEGEPELIRIGDEFATILARHDIAAFQPIALHPAVTHESWAVVRSALRFAAGMIVERHEVMVLSSNAQEALVVVRLEGSGTSPTSFRDSPLALTFTLRLLQSGNGWCIGSVSTTARDLAVALIAGDREWEAIRRAEPFVSPSYVAYHMANEGSKENVAPERAEAAIDYAECLARDAHDDTMVAFADFARSRVAFYRKDFAKAVQLGEKALAEARATGDPDTIASALFGLGLAENGIEHADQSLAHFEEAVSMVRELRNPFIAISSAGNVIFIESNRQNYRAAIPAAHRALDLAREFHYSGGLVEALFNLGAMHDKLRYFEAARGYYQDVVRIARENNNHGRLAEALAHLAADDFELGDLAHAEEHFREAMKLSSLTGPIEGIQMHVLYGTVLVRQGRYAEAEAILAESIVAAQRANEGSTAAEGLTAMSVMRRNQRRFEEAIRLAREALAQSHDKELYPTSCVWPAHSALGEALRQAGHAEEAMASFRAAIDVIESERRNLATQSTRFLGGKEEPYHALIEILAIRGRAGDALEVAERMRGQRVAKALKDSDRESSLTAEEQNQQEQLERRLAEVNKALMAAGAAKDNLRVRQLREELAVARLDVDRFDVSSGIQHAAPHAAETLAVAKLQLPDRFAGTAVVEYMVTPRSTIAFTLMGTTLTVRVLPLQGKELGRRVDAFCRRIEGRDLDYAAEARRLYEDLILPVEPAIRKARALTIVPDGELWRLPFHALLRPGGRFVVERFEVSYAPSLAMLLQAERRGGAARPKATLLALGNPVVGTSATARLRDIGYDGPIGRLPDAEREVRAIGSLYGRDQRSILIGAAANERAFKEQAPRYDVLHLATHGFLDDRSPMYSALLLAPTPNDPLSDGLLETREILRMRLHARLAVLAACNTGRGLHEPGEGVIGISWAFLMAGCPTTVVTQWNTTSSAAASLMIQFHRRLSHGAGSAAALRQVQIAMLHDRVFAHPYYWAPFVVVGAP
jgi:CHAT domain-containing protein